VDLSKRRDVAELTLVGAVTAIALLGVWTEMHYATVAVPNAVGAYAITLGAAAPLLVRNRWSIQAAAVTLLLCYLYRALGYPGFAIAILVFLVCYTLAMQRGVVYGLIPAFAAWIIPALPPHSLPLLEFAVSMPPLSMAMVALIGESNRRRRLDYEARVRESAATAEAQLGRRMAEERLRIARELHDVLAHTISVVAVQSSVALDALEESPQEAREALLAVRGAAKQAMPELRAALDLLRSSPSPQTDDSADGARRPEALPQPGLRELPELVDQARNSGLAVELTMDQDAHQAPPLVQLTAYRIAQESLTNVRKHAAASRASVTLRRSEDVLSIEVLDDGAGPGLRGSHHGSEADQASGFGLLGMRERVEALGGEFAAGPRPEGGYRVHALLPWPPETSNSRNGAS